MHRVGNTNNNNNTKSSQRAQTPPSLLQCRPVVIEHRIKMQLKKVKTDRRSTSESTPVSFELRRLRADLVMCYKVVFGLVKLSFADVFAFSPVTVTRGLRTPVQNVSKLVVASENISLLSVWLHRGIVCHADTFY